MSAKSSIKISNRSICNGSIKEGPQNLTRRFLRYTIVGVFNTAVHWSIFLLLNYFLGMQQGLANLIAFMAAATVSFLINASWTFQAGRSSQRYIVFVLFMGWLSYIVGYFAEILSIQPLLTLILFSLTSLFFGFAYSNFIVFGMLSDEGPSQ